MFATARESLAAHTRSHPGVGDEADREKIREKKDSWNKIANWVMNERRIEKLRALGEERDRRLREVAKADDYLEALGSNDGDRTNGLDGGFCPKKARTTESVPLPSAESHGVEAIKSEGGRIGISKMIWTRPDSPAPTVFGPSAVLPCNTPRRTASPSLAGVIRPALSTPQRPNSPRRLDKKRNGIYTGMGEYSPRGRGGTYTPPRILPSGDETAPTGANGSPAPSLHRFDFVSPLGPVKLGKLSNGDASSPMMARKASLEAVREDPAEDDGKGWTVVQGKRGRRAGSMPCREKAEGISVEGTQGEGMDLGS